MKLTILAACIFSIGAVAQEIQPSAAQQIEALIKEKQSRTPEQAKLDSHLHYFLKMRRGEPVADGIQTIARMRNAIQVDQNQNTLLDLRASVTPELLDQLTRMGAQIVESVPPLDHIQARIPLARIEEIAGLPAIAQIAPAQAAMTHGAPRRASRAPIRSRLKMLFSGTVTSQGDVAHQANLVRSQLQFAGSGVKVGVISDGVDNLAASQNLGDLPNNVTVLAGQFGTGKEGTAMLEIIFDLAPKAQLFFATAGPSPAAMAANIRALQNAGCHIIVDDVTFRDEPAFQDGIIAQAVNDVTSKGVLYFSAAGNFGNVTDGTSGVWEGDFSNSGTTLIPAVFPELAKNILNVTPAMVHSFGTATSNQINALGGKCPHDLDATGQCTGTVTNGFCSGYVQAGLCLDWRGGFVSLQWSDPFGASANDYDLFILDSTLSNILETSNNVQNGTQDPLEWVLRPNAAGERVVVVLYSGQARALRVDTWGGSLAVNTAGASYGHNAAANTFSVAAINVAAAGGGAFTGGTANHVEKFVSDGPRRLFYNPDGSAITAGNVLFGTNGGSVLQKPDLTAADGVVTTNAAFNPFFGTSAAAPHAAAIAALMLSANPNLTRAQVASVLKSTALDIETPGFDSLSGAGILMALPSVKAVVPSYMSSPTPGATLPGPSATFSWNSVQLASQYWLSMGATPGGADLLNSGPLQGTSFTIHSLPVNGATVYVRLWTELTNSWTYRDYIYTAFKYPYSTMISPVPGSKFGSTTVTFSWTAFSGATRYWIDIGTTPGGNQISGSTRLVYYPLATSYTQSGLPTGGVPIYVRLSTFYNGIWHSIDYVYYSE